MIFNRLIPGLESGEFYTKTIDHSCRFNDDDSAYLSRTPGSAGDLRTFVMFSGWIKRCNLGITCPIVFVDGAVNDDILELNSSDQLTLTLAGTERRRTTQLFRDPTSWFHLYVAIDSTQATAADRIIIEVNGVGVTAFGVETDPAENDQFNFNNTVAHYIGRRATSYADMYLAETFMVDGTAPANSTFTQLKYNICIPKTASPTYGTNGVHLDFEAAADLGNDVSGNNNDWTSSGLTTADQVDDTPTNNYPTMNILDQDTTGLTAVFRNGNLAIDTRGTGEQLMRATMEFPLSGKWYYEIGTATDNDNWFVGVKAAGDPIKTGIYLGLQALECGYFVGGGGDIYINNVIVQSNIGEAVAGDIVGIAVDIDSNEMSVYVNNVLKGVAQTLPSLAAADRWVMALSSATDISVVDLSVNFGQLGFTYTPPSGYQALCSANLDDPDISDCSKGVVTAKDTGANIATTLAAARSGWGSYIDIFKNLDAAEPWDIIFSDDSANSIHFDTDAAKGTKQTLVSGNNYLGASLRVGATYGCYTAEISHTNGSETNQAHGLGSADLAIAKLTNIAGDWWMSHPKLTANYNIKINTTAAETATEYVEVDNTNVTIKSAAPTGTYRVIVFKEIEGFSKFGAFNGNAAADGPFAHSGLRPALSLVRDADGVVNCLLFNQERLGYNVDNNELHPNTNDIEGTTDMVDLVSNGKKIRTTNAEINTTAHNYIFLDWAEQPGKWANAR